MSSTPSILDEIADALEVVLSAAGHPDTASRLSQELNRLHGSRFSPSMVERSVLSRRPERFRCTEAGLWALVSWPEELTRPNCAQHGQAGSTSAAVDRTPLGADGGKTYSSGTRQLPLRHITIRVPWHDTGWTGCVCSNPAENTHCLILKNVYQQRNQPGSDEHEARLAGKSWEGLSPDDWPPARTSGLPLWRPIHANGWSRTLTQHTTGHTSILHPLS